MSSAASDVYKRQVHEVLLQCLRLRPTRRLFPGCLCEGLSSSSAMLDYRTAELSGSRLGSWVLPPPGLRSCFHALPSASLHPCPVPTSRHETGLQGLHVARGLPVEGPRGAVAPGSPPLPLPFPIPTGRPGALTPGTGCMELIQQSWVRRRRAGSGQRSRGGPVRGNSRVLRPQLPLLCI